MPTPEATDFVFTLLSFCIVYIVASVTERPFVMFPIFGGVYIAEITNQTFSTYPNETRAIMVTVTFIIAIASHFLKMARGK